MKVILKSRPTKSETDGAHPSAHYLVVEDPKLPTTWHLRIRDVGGALDHGLMGAAWAALHGGYRGNKYEGPQKQAAIGRLTHLYDQEKMALPKIKARLILKASDDCECLQCGYRMPREGRHCMETPCPKCGGEMRRADRPGVGAGAGAGAGVGV